MFFLTYITSSEIARPNFSDFFSSERFKGSSKIACDFFCFPNPKDKGVNKPNQINPTYNYLDDLDLDLMLIDVDLRKNHINQHQSPSKTADFDVDFKNGEINIKNQHQTPSKTVDF